MIKKIIFIGDHYRGNQDKNVKILFELISPIFVNTNIKTNILLNTTQYENSEKWIESLNGEGLSALNNYNLENVAVVGFEMNPIDKKFLNHNNIPWIDFEIHPIRFLEDLYFSITTSFEFDIGTLSIEDNHIQFAANILKLKNLEKNYNIENNSLLIIGQTPKDKSVFFDNEFKSLINYKNSLDKICRTYNKVYYRPHPNLTNTKVDEEIIERFNASLLSDESYYDLLSNEEIITICGISSSSLHEGKYFNKNIIFLEERVKTFSKPVNLKSLLECSELWFKKLLSMNDLISSDLNFSIPDNTCRDSYGSWSYETPLAKINNKLSINETKVTQAEEKATQAEAKASEAEVKASEAEAKASEAEVKASEAEVKASEAEVRTNDALHHYHTIVNSNSWKLTKPYRYAGRKFRWFKGNAKAWLTFAPTSRPRKVLKSRLITLKYYIYTHPKLKMKILAMLKPFPKLENRLKKVGKVAVSRELTLANPTDIRKLEQLSPKAKEIYMDLKRSIAEQKGNK